MTEKTGAPSRRNRKLAAIGAAVLVVGVGATYTLATWNDSEWVWGGANGDPALGTSSFEVQQNTTAPYADSAASWVDEEENPGGSLTFSPGALALTPGDTVFAPVALRTTADSLAADVTLQAAVAAAGASQNDQALFDAVRVSVYTVAGATPATACTTGFDSTGWASVLQDQPLTTMATATQSLAAQSGSTQHYCFAITLPESTPDVDLLQGMAISPAWEFRSVSVAS